MKGRGNKHGGCRGQMCHVPSSSTGRTQSHGHTQLQGSLGHVVHQSAQEGEETADTGDQE